RRPLLAHLLNVRHIPHEIPGEVVGEYINQQNRQAPAGAGAGGFGGQAPGGRHGLQAANPGGPQQDAFGGRGPQRPAAPGDRNRQPQLPPRGGPRAELPGGDPQQRTPDWADTQAPLSRASLDAPRGHDEQDPSQTSRMPRVDDRQGPGATAEIPRIDAQGPAATGEFPRPELSGPSGTQGAGGFPRPESPRQTGQFARPGTSQPTGGYARPDAAQQEQYGRPDTQQDRFASQPGNQQGSGSFVRSDVFGTPASGRPDGGAPNAGQNTGQFAAPQGYDGGSTGQHALPGRQNPAGGGQFGHPQPGGRDAHAPQDGPAGFGAPRLPAPQQQRPVRREPDHRGAAQRPDEGRGASDAWALPPASGPGDGRTPLYDTLETNWFHGSQQQGGAPAPQQAQQQPAPAQSEAPAPQRSVSHTGSWRTSPNDELVRQAERVRQPAAGGVTTSGLPRRVPRANLVPGTAQQQQHQAGPQVSRAPDDVRGRLTNLRRGIAQGRQAGSGQTGSFPSPTHQQER
ncbi:hypothetical protein ABVB68_32465, partial [Streptomyces sp. NPDC096012]